MIPEDLKSKLFDICEKDARGEYYSETAKSELYEMVKGLTLDHTAAPPRIHGKKDLVYWSQSIHGAFAALALLDSCPKEQQEEAICWMLGGNATRKVGAGCYSLILPKSDPMYRSCFQTALRETNPSSNSRYVEPCCRHKGQLQVYGDIHRMVLDEKQTDEDRAGALNMIYWTGVESWPSVEDYDSYMAAPEQVVDESTKVVFDALQNFTPTGLKKEDFDRDRIREMTKKQYARYMDYDRNQLAFRDQLRFDVSNCCLTLFLDDKRSIQLRKMAWLHFPHFLNPNSPPWLQRMLSEDNRKRMLEVRAAAEIFPDGYIQSTLSSGTRKDRIPVLHSITTPLTWRQKLRIAVKQIWRQITFRL